MQNRHNDVTVTGVLRNEGDTVFIESGDGSRFFEEHTLWKGYQSHWLNQKVQARMLPQKDYQKGQNIILLWPFRETDNEPFIELYYNERLVKYPASLLGHLAVNVNNEIFNFSHLLNENEIITPEEYFYRPALGEFSPHPEKKCFNTDDLSHPYYDKFGRNFMRTIHVARIVGVDTKRLSEYYKEQLQIIHATISNPVKPEIYSDFNFITRSCTTIIRDGLNEIGFSKLKGIFPRDMFISAIWDFLNHHKAGTLMMTLHVMKQLKVEEAEYSKLSPLMNTTNMLKYRLLKKKGYNI